MTLSLIVFAFVTLSLMGLYFVFNGTFDADRARLRKRFSEEFKAAEPTGTQKALFKNTDVFNLNTSEEYALLTDEVAPKELPFRQRLRKWAVDLLEEARVPLSLAQAAAVQLAVPALLGAAGFYVGRWPGLAAGLAVGAALPVLYLQMRAKARKDRLLDQLPNAFELMARVIRSGQSVPQSIQAVAEAFEDPLASLFDGCKHKESLGLPADLVFRDMALRTGVVELRIFVIALAIQRQVGGNLSETLERLAVMIRDRLRLRKQIRTLTAEGRLQGYTLAVLPFVVFLAIYFMNRPFAMALLGMPGLLWATAGLMTFGLLWIRRIIDID